MSTDAPLQVAALERAAAIMAASQDAIIALDIRGRVTDWNPGAEALFGYQAAELLGRSVACLLPKGERDESDAARSPLRAGERILPFDARRLRRDGREIEVSIAVSPILDGRGEPVGECQIVRDVTARRQAERSEQAIARRLADVKTALDEHAIVAVMDATGTIVEANDRLCAISKYQREALLGQTYHILRPEASGPARRALQVAAGRGRIWRGELKNRAGDGSFFWTATTLVPFLDLAGRPREYIAVSSDVSAMRASEQARQDLERFAYAASHDLQEPLRAIAGCLQILERRLEGRLDDHDAELFHHAVEGARRLQALIEGLLAFARVSTADVAFQPVEVATVLEGALQNLAVAIQESGAVLTHDPLPVLLADPVSLTLLFQNLIGNAIKFRGPEPPRLHLGVRRENGWCHFELRDNGIGIDPQFLERIFQIFQRLHSRRDYPGSGVGLAVCRRIVERHGGTIRAESSPGHGSCFEVRLPLPP